MLLLFLCVAAAQATQDFERLCAGTQFSPVMPAFPSTRYVVHDMSSGPAPEPRRCFLKLLRPTVPAECYRYYVGKYDERRPSVYQTDMFADSNHTIDGYSGIRDVHVGLDLGAPPGTEVHAPLDGIVHSFGYNSEQGDYGHVIVTQHTLLNTTFWLLFGHLSADSVAFKRVGSVVKSGDAVGKVGRRHENGDWPAHLHLQVSLLEPATHDMPGVVSQVQRLQALKDYPDPRHIVGPVY